MIEAVGDLWVYQCDALCVPTNGVLDAYGRLVMGAGVALEAARRRPNLPTFWGGCVRASGNVPAVYRTPSGPALVSFPTKGHWRRPADLAMIHRSAVAMVAVADREGWKAVALPRVGCGLGGLRWDDVLPAITSVLDDRFVALSPAE